MEVAKKSMAQMYQRTRVRGESVLEVAAPEFCGAACKVVALFDCGEEKFSKLFG
jgi:hypothetical protein